MSFTNQLLASAIDLPHEVFPMSTITSREIPLVHRPVVAGHTVSSVRKELILLPFSLSGIRLKRWQSRCVTDGDYARQIVG